MNTDGIADVRLPAGGSSDAAFLAGQADAVRFMKGRTMEYAILEDNLSRLEAKLTRISNKCKKYGCSFIYEKLGEQYKTLTNEHGFEYQAKFIIVRVEGTAVVNNWEFVAFYKS